MAYTTGDIIRDDEYNTFATGSTSGAATAGANVNHVWGVGNGDAGYGQSTTLAAVAAGDTVTATQWSALLDRIESMSAHQGGSINMTNPVTGDIISIISNLANNITTIHTNRLNAGATAAASAATTVSRTTAWAGAAGPQTVTHTFTVTFASGDAARYFFNCGGYIDIDPSVLNYADNPKERSWSALTQMFGQFRLRAQSSGLVNETTSATVTESHTSNDVSDSVIGYHDLTTSNQLVVTKTLTTSGNPYLSPSANNITVNVRSNGAQGSNGDKGSVITIVVTYSDASADTDTNDVITGTLTSSLTFYEPSTTSLTKTWGTPTVGGAAS